MLNKFLKLFFGLLFFTVILQLQGDCATHFQQALPGYHYSFPFDHGAHERYKTEWWYYTGHLKTKLGKSYGYELTFFRTNPGISTLPKKSYFSLKNIYLTHFALSDENNKQFYHTEIRHRNEYGVAGALSKTYNVWNENMSVKQVGNQFVLQADRPNYSIKLKLAPLKPLVIHGKNGVSQKASCKGCASHYYSYTRLQSLGTLRLGGKTESVKGLSWMDHEFGSNQLTAKQVGWDWFSIQLNNQTELMLYQLRNVNKTMDPNSSGTFVSLESQVKHLRQNQFIIKPLSYWTSPAKKASYPIKWQVLVPELDLTLMITPRFENQELVAPSYSGLTYWEGSCKVTGKQGNKIINGEAYVEMTGYAEHFRQKI